MIINKSNREKLVSKDEFSIIFSLLGFEQEED